MYAVGRTRPSHTTLLPQRPSTGSTCKFMSCNVKSKPYHKMNYLKKTVQSSSITKMCFLYFLQDLLTSSLLSEDGHKAYHFPRRGMSSPLQVCIHVLACICRFIFFKNDAKIV